MSEFTYSDLYYIDRCLALAAAAAARGEVPVGALCVHEGEVVGVGSNRREADHDPVAHAEVDALRMAAARLGRWRLSGVTLYVTLEPCTMCAGALVLSRVDRVVYATDDPKAGAMVSLYQIGEDERLNHLLPLTRGPRAAEASDQLSDFFRARRAAAKERKCRGRSL